MTVFSITGATIAAFFTGYLNPYWCFGYYGIFGFVVAIVACFLNKELEQEDEIPVSTLVAEAENRAETEANLNQDSNYREAASE